MLPNQLEAKEELEVFRVGRKIILKGLSNTISCILLNEVSSLISLQVQFYNVYSAD